MMDELPSLCTERREGRRKALDDPYLHRLQARHFVLYDVFPGLLCMTAVVLAGIRPIGITELALFFALWLLTGLGISAGYHRLFTHRSWDAVRPVRIALAIFGSMAGQGPVISWAAMHRRHHECTDRDGDMHSPNLHGATLRGRLRGLLHAHYTWMFRHPYPNVAFYAPDLVRDRDVVWVGTRYSWWIALGFVLPALVGAITHRSLWGAFMGFLWGGGVRMWVVGNSIWALNSVLHAFGTRRFTNAANHHDQSRNSWLLAILVWGEGWHNNHHAFPASASFGLEWFRPDLSFWVIRILERCGLAHNVRIPPRDRIAKRDQRHDGLHDTTEPTQQRS